MSNDTTKPTTVYTDARIAATVRDLIAAALSGNAAKLTDAADDVRRLATWTGTFRDLAVCTDTTDAGVVLGIKNGQIVQASFRTVIA